MPKKNFHPMLEKAVKEYYEYLGDKKFHTARWIENKHSRHLRTSEYGKKTEGYKLLLVRIVDENGCKFSALMSTQSWADGHWDVTEEFYCEREDEQEMIRNFEESEEYV